MGKYHKIYTILKCNPNTFIPICDQDCWEHYPDYRWVYNKINICAFQNIDHAPMPIEPSQFPVIIKPIINLYGMGLNVIKVDSLDQFYDQWYNNNFWMTFFDGDHLSWDFVLHNGSIVFHSCFIGHKDPDIIGKFDYWESINNIKWPNIINKLVTEKFSSYTGCLNIETIGHSIIEVHLRMGDIDVFPTLDILKGIIAVYENRLYDWSNIVLPKVFFFPVWNFNNLNKKVYEYLKKNIAPLLLHNQCVHDVTIDSSSLANPSSDQSHKRLMHFTCSNYDFGFYLRNSIYSDISKFKH